MNKANVYGINGLKIKTNNKSTKINMLIQIIVAST